MTNTTKNWVIAILILIILTGVFFGGFFTYKKINPCPVSSHDTIKIIDTVIHFIPDSIPYYIVKRDSVKYRDQKWMDSVLLATKVDTAAILREYYALHYYDRIFEDTLLKAELKDVISENQFKDNVFSYQIKRPQIIVQNIDNSVTYSKYIYLGAGLVINDPKYSNLEILYAYKRGYAKIGYLPFQNGFVVGGGFKLIKLR
jgi:hypothetical protein